MDNRKVIAELLTLSEVTLTSIRRAGLLKHKEVAEAYSQGEDVASTKG